MSDTFSDDEVFGAPSGGGGKTFSDADVMGGTAPDTTATLAKQPFIGFNKSLAEAAGAPVDIANWGMRKIGVPVSDQPFMGSDWIKSQMGRVGVNPDEQPAPVGLPQKVLRGMGEGVGQALGLEAAAVPVAKGLAGVAPRAAEAVGSLFGKGTSVGASATNATVGGAGGATGEFAAELAPDQWKTAARVGGNMAGGVGGAGLSLLPRGASAAFTAGKNYFAPFTEAGRERVAADLLRKGMDDPSAVASRLHDGNFELVPGSTPTVGQLTGDMGALSMEREAATASPDKFKATQAAQNAARVEAMHGVQQTGDPADVSRLLRQNLDHLDQATEQSVANVTAGARASATAAGGQGQPEAVGSSLRGRLSEAKEASRQRRNALYDAVDPDGTMHIVTAPLRDDAARVASTIDQMAKPPSGEEAAISELMQNLPDAAPFRSLQALDSRITAAMAEERRAAGESPVWGRLVQLKRAVAGAIDNGVENQIAHERALVERGAISPESTIESRLQREVDQFVAGRAERAATGSGAAGGEPPAAAAGVFRAERQGQGGSGGAPRDPGLPPEPNFDPAAAERLNEAKQAHREYSETFKQGPVGETLRTQGFSDNFRVPDSGVGAKAFVAGPKGREVGEAFLAANPEARSDIADYAAYLLRQKAFDPATGMIDPRRLAAFQSQYSEALRAYPEVAQRFRDAATATEAVASAQANRRAMLDHYQQGAVGKIIGAQTPDEVTAHVGAIFGKPDATTQMQRLVNETAGDPNAREGLRKAVADFIATRFMSNAEVGASGVTGIRQDQFQTFVRKNERALRQVFTPQEVSAMQAIAADIQRSQRTLQATRLTGQSNTAQDTLKALRHVNEGGGLSTLATIAGLAGAGFAAKGVTGALSGAVLGGAQHIIKTMHAAGMGKVSDLMRDALLNPELARTLLQKASKVPGRGSDLTLANVLAKGAAIPIANSATRQPRAFGGKVAKRDYPAKKASRLQKLANRELRAFGGELKPLMDEPDDVVASALAIANRRH